MQFRPTGPYSRQGGLAYPAVKRAAAGIIRKVVIAAEQGLLGINMGNVEDWEPLMLTRGGAGTSPWQGMIDRNLLTRAFKSYRPSFYALKQVAALITTYRLIEDAVDRLAIDGPALGRPLVDRISGSRHHNMKELRPGSTGSSELHILFAFDAMSAVTPSASPPSATSTTKSAPGTSPKFGATDP